MAVKSPFSRKFLHVGIVVRDMDKTVKRLESLGIGPFGTSNPPLLEKPLFRGKTSDAKVKGLAAEIGQVKLEIGQPVEGESPHKEFLDAKGEGIHHMAFEVDDLENEVVTLTERGAGVILSGRWQGGGFAYLDLVVGNIIIELEQK